MVQQPNYSVTLRFFDRKWEKDPNTSSYRSLDQIAVNIPSDSEIYPFTKRCRHFIKNKVRWENNNVLTELQTAFGDVFGQETNIEHLINLIEKSSLIEVTIPFENENKGWAARVFPWEDILGLFRDKNKNASQALIVIRHLEHPQTYIQPPHNTPVLCVDSAPGKIKMSYDFSTEINLALLAFDPNASYRSSDGVIKDPTLIEFEESLEAQAPSIVHIAALDNIYFDQLITQYISRNKEEETDADHVSHQEDGLVLAGQPGTDYHHVHYTEIAKSLGCLTSPPALISFASCNTYARTAPIAVAEGVGAAIGFDDNLSDEASATFFDKFYSRLEQSEGDLLAAFEAGLLAITSTDHDYYTTPVLWTRYKLLHETREIERIDIPDNLSATSADLAGPNIAPPPISGDMAPDFSGLSPRPDLPIIELDAFKVEWKIKPEINYSHLHNQRDLFETLEITNLSNAVSDVDVQIELIGVGNKAVWRKKIKTNGARYINVIQHAPSLPLGSHNLRRVQETVNASFAVSIRIDGQLRYRNTINVRILPIDQWTDDDENRKWLPSFIMPRDPAVSKIIRSADRYLAALTDNSHAGFDGYQQIYAMDQPDYEVIDLQVRAIWCAILYEHNIRYIDPPPTYSKSRTEQRLRTPTQILAEGRATCIDTSILLASCLEYIGIYPVIYLIWGHAFPGWWRNPERMFFGDGVSSISSNVSSAIPRPEKDKGAAWVMDQNLYGDLLERLSDDSLAAIESTELCNGGGFMQSIAITQGHFSDVGIFDAMIDVRQARISKNPVTPLPVVFGEFDDN